MSFRQHSACHRSTTLGQQVWGRGSANHLSIGDAPGLCVNPGRNHPGVAADYEPDYSPSHCSSGCFSLTGALRVLVLV
jgi:hypothetical protein